MHSYEHNEANIKFLLESHDFYFIPFVNIDTYAKIFETYQKSKFYPMYRKNRHNEGKCSDMSLGVDLNRNYAFNFASDNEGSSPDKCSEIYRGKYAFSEPETRAIRDFFTDNSRDIRIAINFHSWGNLFIIPYDDLKWDKEYVKKDIFKMYTDIKNTGLLPQN